MLCLCTSISMLADKNISMTVTVGIPFTIRPYADSGLSEPYNDGTSSQYIVSDQTMCTISSNKYKSQSTFSDTFFYDYTITATKSGAFYFAETIRGKRGSFSTTETITYTINAVDVTSISIPSELSLTTGDNYTITPTIIPTIATPILSWYSSNPSIVSVENGSVAALTEGTATITCMANNGVSATCEVTVNPQMNYLYSADFAGGAGGHVTLPVLMKNDINVAGFQFDLIMPEGVTLTTKSDGTADAIVTSRTSTHTLTGTTLPSGAVRFTVFSLSNSLITGTEGSVMNIRFDIDKDTPLGDYEVRFTNVQLTQKDGSDLTTVYAPDQTLKLTVGSILPGDVNADGVVNVTDAIGIISFILEDTPTWFTESVADVNGDGKINVTDVIAVIDMIMSGAN